MNGALEKLIDAVTNSRNAVRAKEQEEALQAFTRLIDAKLGRGVREGLELTTIYDLANDYAYARGEYRGVILDLIYNSATDSWSVARNGGVPTRLTSGPRLLEARLLAYLGDLRVELDTAAADVEIPPALTGPEYFQLSSDTDGAIHMMIGSNAQTHRFSDADVGMAGWLNDHVAPVLVEAQRVAAQGVCAGDEICITIDTFRALNAAVVAYQEELAWPQSTR
jgi:hypothetical protein